MQIGWICPKCRRGINPNVAYCNCDNNHYTPFSPFTPKPLNPIEETKINCDDLNPNTVTSDKPYKIIY